MENIQAIADKSAIALSFLCALHCLLLPAAIVLYPSTLGFLPGDESVHFALLFVVIPISAYALIKGGKVHKSRKVFITGISGLLVLVAAVVLGHDIVRGNWRKNTYRFRFHYCNHCTYSKPSHLPSN